MKNDQPTILGLKKSFGFGDRLGLAGTGHLEALAREGRGFAPILAQQSIREMTRTDRTPADVMNAARTAIATTGFADAWGADADHLKTEQDVIVTTEAAFTFFTIDPSDFVNNSADDMSLGALEEEVVAQVSEGLYGDQSVEARYADKSFEIDHDFSLTFDRESLLRSAVKYGRAVAHCETMARTILEKNAGREVEIEVSVDETDKPTAELEHLFFALELQRRGVKVVSLAPRFIGEFEKGIDYKGDHAAFERSLARHVSIAKRFGPYKISVHSGSDKFSIYPAIGRLCGDLLHVKTAGTSYLEALRAVCRADAPLFADIARYSLERFDEDKKTYHISVTPEYLRTVKVTSDAEELEAAFLDENQGRQVLHVTFGSVLTKGSRPNGQRFREAIYATLDREQALHTEIVATHLGKHLRLLSQG